MIAEAASLIPDELAAVTIPSFLKAGLRCEIPSAVTPLLGPSSVSKIKRPPFSSILRTYKYVKQNLQNFVFNMNVPSRWGSQTPFSNITLDWTCPEDLKEKALML